MKAEIKEGKIRFIPDTDMDCFRLGQAVQELEVFDIVSESCHLQFIAMTPHAVIQAISK